jgi:hypothetical protein
MREIGIEQLPDWVFAQTRSKPEQTRCVRLRHDMAAVEARPLEFERRIRICRPENAAPKTTSRPLSALRFDIAEAAQILRMSRGQLYNRICDGTIKPQKDGLVPCTLTITDVSVEQAKAISAECDGVQRRCADAFVAAIGRAVGAKIHKLQ